MPESSHESGKETRYRVRVESQEEIADGVFYLKTDRPFDFLPGQCVALAIRQDEQARYYSIASGRSETRIGILYDLVPEGKLTPELARLGSGDELLMSDPFGSFVDGEEVAVWIATGTGIAPFLSIARSLPSTAVARTKMLIHGSRTLERFYFREELRDLIQERFVCCCSQCDGNEADAQARGSGFYAGRLTEWLRGAVAEGTLAAGPRYFLCGAAGMVVEVRDLLISAGIPFEDILSEIYF
jgi:ferredoxin/flavodoxin---NADP+ reductase